MSEMYSCDGVHYLSLMRVLGGVKALHSEFVSLQGFLVCTGFFAWLGAGCAWCQGCWIRMRRAGMDLLQSDMLLWRRRDA